MYKLFKFTNQRSKEQGLGIIWPNGIITTWSDTMGIATYSHGTTLDYVGGTVVISYNPDEKAAPFPDEEY